VVVTAALVVIAAALVWGARQVGFVESSDEAFRRLAAAYEDRVVLIESGLKVGDDYVKLADGTGFVAGDDGLIVTNKHVVHGHLYSESMACIAESFRRRGLPFEQALVVTIWPGGTTFRQTSDSPQGDRWLGFSTEDGTLALVAVAPDTLQPEATLECADAFGGGRFEMRWQRHAQDNSDLAVLRTSKPMKAIPLANREPEADEPVMVYGFPRGVGVLETNDAEPIRRVGRVLRTQETIQIDAVVLPGNSGGPLVDRAGEVVGITTRGFAESMSQAIKVEYARHLLDRARLRDQSPPGQARR
jgi:S1-C subfamily serine protease